MQTQSVDTHPATEQVMIELIRRASLSKRFRLVQSLTQSMAWSNIHAWQESHPQDSEQEAAVHFVHCSYGAILAKQVHMALQMREHWHVHPTDLVAVMLPAVQVVEELNIPYYLAGSLASSVHGMQQMAQDIDLVVDLAGQAPAMLGRMLKQSYVLDEEAIEKAKEQQSSFSLVHLDTLMKVDIIIPASDAFHTCMRQFIAVHTLDEHYPPLSVASALEMILFKLYRYHCSEQSYTNGLHDDAQWNDIVGMLKVQGPDLDLTLLQRWAKTLGITPLWQRALLDTGLRAA